MPIEYATIDEAWANSAPPQQYPEQPGFDVGRYDGSKLDNNFCKMPDQALESAYPTPSEGRYDNMYGARDPGPLKFHKQRPDACPPSGPDGEGAPTQQYGAEWPPGSDIAGGSDEGAARRAALSNEKTSPTPTADKPSGKSERSALYDILIFVLFGLLLLLTIHEAAALGEAVGIGRQAAKGAMRSSAHMLRSPMQSARSFIPSGFSQRFA